MARVDSKEIIIEEKLKEIEKWISNGVTEKEIAKNLGIAYSTFRKHKTTMSALREAIKEGLEEKNQEVEKALYKKCIGYHYFEQVATKVKKEKLADDNITVLTNEEVEVTEVKKYSLPDLAAQKYYLNNRDKVKWKEDPHKVANDKENTKLKKKEIESKNIF